MSLLSEVLLLLYCCLISVYCVCQDQVVIKTKFSLCLFFKFQFSLMNDPMIYQARVVQIALSIGQNYYSLDN